jgi:hypothetical protein
MRGFYRLYSAFLVLPCLWFGKRCKGRKSQKETLHLSQVTSYRDTRYISFFLVSSVAKNRPDCWNREGKGGRVESRYTYRTYQISNFTARV